MMDHTINEQAEAPMDQAAHEVPDRTGLTFRSASAHLLRDTMPPLPAGAPMRVIAPLITLAAAASLTLGAPASAQSQTASVRTTIQDVVRAYVKAHNEADATAMMEAVARDAAVSSISDGEITRGWEAIRQGVDGITGNAGRFQFAVGTMDVTLLGTEHALVVAPATLTVGTDQGDVQVKGAFSLILRKAGSRWLVLHEHFSTQAETAG